MQDYAMLCSTMLYHTNYSIVYYILIYKNARAAKNRFHPGFDVGRCSTTWDAMGFGLGFRDHQRLRV